ncbi:MAG TPA: hypothetical protein DDW52_29020 [Planctomycetaceae bacterium]|nr:hypothetical protein [Planctomycetaceae bacterium]
MFLLHSPAAAQRVPPPGALYKEYSWVSRENKDWRVTDEDAVQRFPERAAVFLPNPIREFEIASLQNATRVDLILDRWGGHRGTINKRISLNGGQWLPLPEPAHIPKHLRAEDVMYQDNVVIQVPLSQIREGKNTLQAACDEEGGFGWGQWGINAFTVRVFYDDDTVRNDVQLSGDITSPQTGATITDAPRIEVKANSASGVARVDIIAAYVGYDEDGDGDFGGWHVGSFQWLRGAPMQWRDHVATLWRKPYSTVWDTHWVPDQEPGAISLVARIQDSRGFFFITEPVTDLTLKRTAHSVQLFTAEGMTTDHGVRAGETKDCFFTLPKAIELQRVTESALHFRSWHGWDGHHDPIQFNSHRMAIDGKNHFYDYDLLQLPINSLVSGQNVFRVHSETEHHQLEVLWPGPALVVRIDKRAAAPEPKPGR